MTMKVLIIYDSLSGNTEKMAFAISEGVKSIEGVEAEIKKIGESFPLTKLTEADFVFLGSPVIYANITDGMRNFLDNVQQYIEAGKIDMGKRQAAVFGSYGYDGAWIMEERLKGIVEDLGYEVNDKVCVEIDSNIKYNLKIPLETCRSFGKEIAESLTR